MVSADGVDGGGAAAAVGDKMTSTVVPAEVTGDNRVHELTNMDLAMKLHYLRMVYYYPAGGAGAGLTVPELKYPMFRLLEVYYPACGRFRRSDSGRPAIKCNDSGVRVVEARCGMTLQEWLDSKELSHHKHLAPNTVLGPDLYFSPPVEVQFTRFKCGGLALGFGWSHVLGDAASAANFACMYGQILSGNPPQKLHYPQNPQAKSEKPPGVPLPGAAAPLSIKQVKPVGDCWLPTSEAKMESFSFHVTGAKLKYLQSKISSPGLTPFALISALIWQTLAKIKGNKEPQIVTICRPHASATRSWIMSNEQTTGTVRVDFSPSKAELSELATSLAKGLAHENNAIEGQVEAETGAPDHIVYGANLTFVDLEDFKLYELELKGQKPAFVNYSIEGVGKEGTVLVFQGPKAEGEDSGGRIVNVIFPEDQVRCLRKELEADWNIA
ncbi:hypothetical protein Taro_019807 [Colocasia esculenta]|uniref:Uncharacterized protein n=1 Tax=Colocasia esculenta TaxID=4460 RepID=A0A843UUS9_COLES|nr:hypothetical protein [Colocasia esculenta]